MSSANRPEDSERTTIIIGNGISGVTAARHIRKRSDRNIVVISSETPYFYSRTALMYVYMGHMKFEHTQPYENWFWDKNRIRLMQDRVIDIDFKVKSVRTENGIRISYDELILAVGSKPNKFGWPGQDLNGVQGLYSKQDLDLLEANTDPYGKPQRVKKCVIVGGGLIGIEFAEMVMSRGIPVTFLVRESHYWGNVLPKEESELVMRHMREHHVDLKTNTELSEIVDRGDGRVGKVITNSGEEISCDLVGLTAGVSPNIDFLREAPVATDRGIIVDQHLRTDQEDVYAIGDCAQFSQAVEGRRNIEQVWYTGRIMGETVAKTITGDPTPYNPGHWFNSAKFFDIEYQTYGHVLPQPKEGEAHFYWESNNGKMSFRMNYRISDDKLLGVNVFGMRMRHEMFDKWLTEGRSIDKVMTQLSDVMFDPEFTKPQTDSIVAHFNQSLSRQVKAEKKSLQRIFRR